MYQTVFCGTTDDVPFSQSQPGSSELVLESNLESK